MRKDLYQKCLQHIVDIKKQDLLNAITPEGNTMLIDAIANSSLDLAYHLMDCYRHAPKGKTIINFQDLSYHNTALHLVSAKRRSNITNGFLNYKTYLDIAKFLIEEGADPNLINNRHNLTPLDLAVITRDVALINIILNSPILTQDTIHRAIENLNAITNLDEVYDIIASSTGFLEEGVSCYLTQEELDSPAELFNPIPRQRYQEEKANLKRKKSSQQSPLEAKKTKTESEEDHPKPPSPHQQDEKHPKHNQNCIFKPSLDQQIEAILKERSFTRPKPSNPKNPHCASLANNKDLSLY